MAASLSTPVLTIEEFERLYGGETPAYEYWDGLAIQKPVPTLLHSLLQFVLQVLLKQKGLAAAAEVRIKLNSIREPVPDVIAVRRPRAPYPDKPMAIVIEILSPDDTVQRIHRKCRFYAAQGIPGIYVFDPEDRTAERWSEPDNALLPVAALEIPGQPPCPSPKSGRRSTKKWRDGTLPVPPNRCKSRRS